VTVTVRPAAVSDADAVAALAGEFSEFIHALGGTMTSEFSAEAYVRDGFGAHPAFFALVAEQDATVVGYMIYHYSYDVDTAARTLTISDLFVTESTRGQGAGKALMMGAKQVCRDNDIREMAWSVFKWNPSAHPFYERLGAKYVTDEDFMVLEVDGGEGG
jgi:GNAT superfamily N-acetyltransferase